MFLGYSSAGSDSEEISSDDSREEVRVVKRARRGDAGSDSSDERSASPANQAPSFRQEVMNECFPYAHGIDAAPDLTRYESLVAKGHFKRWTLKETHKVAKLENARQAEALAADPFMRPTGYRPTIKA